MNTSKQKTLFELLDQIESRANAATPGPWKVSNYRPQQIIPRDPRESTYERGDNTFQPVAHVEFTHNFVHDKANGNFIAATRGDVPALVKALRRAVEFYSGWADIEGEKEMHAEIAKLLREPADSVGAGVSSPVGGVSSLNPSEHILQMERDAERLDWADRQGLQPVYEQWTKRLSFTVRQAIDAAMASPVSSVERDGEDSSDKRSAP